MASRALAMKCRSSSISLPSDSPKKKLLVEGRLRERINFPARLASRWMPGLFPEQIR